MPLHQEPPAKRPYTLGRRAVRSEETRLNVLQAARRLLETGGAAEFTMENISTQSGASRQTLNNLFGNKEGIIIGLFDHIAEGGGMLAMREVMHLEEASAAVCAFTRVFVQFWMRERILLRRIHGIAALDLDFGQAVRARYARRRQAAEVLARRFVDKTVLPPAETAAALYAFTSFEFFDTLVPDDLAESKAVEQVMRLAERLLVAA
jgi:AcrR family transcriptional regulator